MTPMPRDVHRWGAAHQVVGQHVQQQRRDHGHSLLPGDAAGVVLQLHKLVQAPQSGHLQGVGAWSGLGFKARANAAWPQL